jgi:hypothetical protein
MKQTFGYPKDYQACGHKASQIRTICIDCYKKEIMEGVLKMINGRMNHMQSITSTTPTKEEVDKAMHGPTEENKHVKNIQLIGGMRHG